MFGRVRRGEPNDGVTTARPSCQATAAQVWDASGVARSLVTVLSVFTVLLTSCSSGSDSLRSPTAVHPGGQLTPLLDTTLSVPRWFTATDGSAHLVYELLLTNSLPATVTLNAVEVRNADAGAPLARLSGDSLRAATSLATSPDAPTVQLPPSSVAVVWMEIAIQPKRIPKAITHRITIDPLPDVSTAAVPLTYTGTVVEVDRRPPIVVGHPLAGARWAALGSCCNGPHRPALYPINGRWIWLSASRSTSISAKRQPPRHRRSCAANQLPHLRSAGVRGRGRHCRRGGRRQSGPQSGGAARGT